MWHDLVFCSDTSVAQAVGVHKFIKAADIVKGNPRLNLAFTAAIFNTCPGLAPLTEEQVKTVSEGAAMLDDDHGDSREERAFRMYAIFFNIQLSINNVFSL